MAYVVLLVLLASVLPYVYGSILLRSAVHSISSPSAALCDDLWAEPLLSLFGHVRHDDRTPIKNVPITITFQGNIVGVSVHDGKTVKIVALANETMHMFTDQDGTLT